MLFPRIKYCRMEADKTQAEIAGMLNCRRETYHAYETGFLDVPAFIVIKLAAYYGVTTDYLLGCSENRS